MKQAVSIPINLLIINPDIHKLYPRHTDESYADLKESITRGGMLTPVCVGIRGEHYCILDGETRYHIARELQYEHVSCDICEDHLEESEAIFLNIHRRQLDPEDYQQIKHQEEAWVKKHLNPLDSSILDILKDFDAQRILPKQFFWKLRTYSPAKQRAFANDLKQTLEGYQKTRTENQPISEHDANLLLERNRYSKECSTMQDTIRTLEEQIYALQHTLTTDREANACTEKFSASVRRTSHQTDTTSHSHLDDMLATSIDSLISLLTTVNTLLHQARHSGITIDTHTKKYLPQLQGLITTLTTTTSAPGTTNGTRKLTLVEKNN